MYGFETLPSGWRGVPDPAFGPDEVRILKYRQSNLAYDEKCHDSEPETRTGFGSNPDGPIFMEEPSTNFREMVSAPVPHAGPRRPGPFIYLVPELCLPGTNHLAYCLTNRSSSGALSDFRRSCESYLRPHAPNG